MLELNKYKVHDDSIEIRNNTLYMNYKIQVKILNNLVTIGNLTSKIDKDVWETFRKNNEIKHYLKIKT